MNIRPSSLPMLAQCPQFESQGGEFADAGTLRHGYLRWLVEPPNEAADFDATGIDDADKDSCLWAMEYIRLYAPCAEYPLQIEPKLYPLGNDFEFLFEFGGTPDYVCGNQIFDFKWRPRDYSAQMASYALGVMQAGGFDSCATHLLFGSTQKPERHPWNEASALAVIMPILERAGKGKETPCDYCGWCKKAMYCPALLKQAEAVAAGYSEDAEIKNWHPSQMETGAEIATALKIWRTVISKWGESVEFHALKAAQKNGMDLPGFKLQPHAGKKYCTDAVAAFRRVGLPQEIFMQACDVRMNTSKSYPDKKGIIDLYKDFHGMKKAPASRQVEEKLGDALKKGNESMVLKSIKTNEAESQD